MYNMIELVLIQTNKNFQGGNIMRKFLSVWVKWIIIMYILAWLVSAFLLNSQTVLKSLLLVSFIMSIVTYVYSGMSDRIDVLEKRIKALEGDK